MQTLTDRHDHGRPRAGLNAPISFQPRGRLGGWWSQIKPGLLAAALLAAGVLPPRSAAQNLTWDASTGATAAQNGNGTWNISNTNWWDGSTNVSWVNSAAAIASFGVPGQVNPSSVTVASDIQLKELRFMPVVASGSVSSGSQYVLNGDVAGRVLDFGSGGLIQMDERSSGGSQFVSLGANLRLKGDNLRIQKFSGSTFQYLTLGMTTNPDLTGTLTIGGSIYATITGPGTIQSLGRVVVEAGGSAPLGGTNPVYTTPFSLAGFGNSLAFSGTSYGAIRFTSNNTTISGGILLTADAGVHTNFSAANAVTGIVINSPITDDGNRRAFHRFAFTRGNGTLTLSAANTYGGATVLGRALTGGYSGGITILDFTAATAPADDILYNGLAEPGNLSFIGGNSASVLRLLGRDGATHSQRFATLLVNGSHSVMELQAGPGGAMNISFAGISRTDALATFDIRGPSAGVISTSQPSGPLGPWASFTSEAGFRSWAQVVAGALTHGNLGRLEYSTGDSLAASPYVAGTDLRISAASTGALAVGGSPVLLNTVSMTDSREDRQVSTGAGQVLRLGTAGGVQLVSGARDLVIGTAGAAGSLSAGGAAGDTAGQVFLSNHSSSSRLTVNSSLTNNGTGVVTLVLNGAPGSRTVLNGAGSHTGGTQLSAGILELGINTALGASGTVTVVDGATLALPGDRTISRALAAVGGFGDGGNGALRSMSGANVVTGTVTQSAPAYLAADAGSTLTFQPATPATIILNGGYALTLGGPGTVIVNGSIGVSSSGIIKAGNGLLVLNGTASTYTGTTTVSAGVLRLGTSQALGTTGGVVISPGGTVDMNGQSTDRSFTSVGGAGSGNSGALVNNGVAASSITGTFVLASVASLGGAGSITISNSTGVTGNVLLTKFGAGTLTVIDSTATSARTGANQINEGMLRVQSGIAIAPLGTGAYALNGGTLSLGFDVSNTMTNVVNLLTDSTIVADRASAGAGGVAHVLGTTTVGGGTLTVKAGDNVTGGTVGLTLGTLSIGGVAMRPGNPVFDVQSTASAAAVLTVGALSDQAIAARTLTFQNSGSAASTVTLGTAASSLVDGTLVNIGGGSGALQVNVNNATALGGLAKVNVGTGGTLTAGISGIVLGSLSGSGAVSAGGAFTLTVGNALSSPAKDGAFSGVLSNGAGTLTLTKAGRGTLTLEGSASNSNTGLTTVNAGTLVLAKTGGATALGGSLTIGLAAASTAGPATVRLEGSDQVVSTAALIMHGGSTLDLNGFNQTFLTFSTAFGATVTGGGVLAIANSSGTMTFTGVNSISSALQLTTGTAATRTMALTNVTDVLTLGGGVTQGTASGAITKTGSGTLVISGAGSQAGLTTVSAGVLNIRHGNALGTTASGTTVSAGGTLQLQGGITTTAEALTLSGTGFAGAGGLGFQTGALVNVGGTNSYAGLLTLGAAATVSSDEGTLNITHAGTITGATFGLTLAGAGNGSIASIIGITSGGVTKNGAGTWTLSGVNTSTGVITLNAGTLVLGNGSTGRWSSAPGMSFTGSARFQYAGGATGSTQAFGALTLTSGAGTLQVDAAASGTNALTFTSVVIPAGGGSLNIVSPAGTAVTLTGAVGVNGIIHPRLTYNGADFATSVGGLVGASPTTPAASGLSAGNTSPYLMQGSFVQPDSVAVSAGLKFAGPETLTLGSGVLLTLNNGANTAGGILVTGAVEAVIADAGGAAGLTTDGAGDLVIRTDGVSDKLVLQVPVTATTTGGLTKNGLGTLVLGAAGAYSGVTSIQEGTLLLGSAQAMGTSAAAVATGAVLDLNGMSVTNSVTLNGTGADGAGALVNNVGMAAVGALAVGTGLGSGSIGASIGGAGDIQSTGVLSGSSLLVKTGSGMLVLGDSSGVAQPSVRTGATRIDAGVLRISNSSTALGAATAQLVLNGGTLGLGSSASVAAHPLAVTADSGIVSDVFAPGAGLTHTLGTLVIGSRTLTVSAGENVTADSTNAGVTFGAVTLTGNPVLDVRSPASSSGGTTTLTLGALSDQGVARTITFTNGGAIPVNGIVTLGTAAASLMEGTTVSLGGASAGVTLNLNVASALGTLAQVSVNSFSRLNLGAAQTLASLSGDGTVSASGAFVLTVGNANSSPSLSTSFAGSLVNGGGTLALTKNGLGTLTLSGSNSYTGATVVSAGVLKLGSTTALGATSGVTVSAGATLDLNGLAVDRNLSSLSGVGHEGGGVLVNSSSTTAVITGTTVLGGASRIGGGGSITVSNAGGITGNSLLTKFGAGTLTVTSLAASARSGANQLDEGTLRLQAATAIAPVGTGAMVMNGGTLSLGFDAGGTVGGAVNLLADSTIIVDRQSAGEGGFALTLGALTLGSGKLTVKAGENVTGGSIGLTLGTTLVGGVSLAGGNPVFDVQGTATATAALTLGSLSDQAITPRLFTFQNSGTGPGMVTLATSAGSLLNGTRVRLEEAGAPVTLNLNHSNALGAQTQFWMSAAGTLSLGASATLLSLDGSGALTSSSAAVLTIGNPASPAVVDSSFDGVISGPALSLVKAGPSILSLGGADSNTFAGAGGMVVSEGTLLLAKTGGAIAVPSSLTIDAGSAITRSAVVRLLAGQQISSSAMVTMRLGAVLDLNGFHQDLGGLGGNDGGVILNNASGTASLLTVGAGGAGGSFLGRIIDSTQGTGTVSLVKAGSGTLVLGGANQYSGTTVVQAGVLQAGAGGVGQTGSGAVSLENGAVLSGTGLVAGGSFTAAAGSTVHAGDGTAQGVFGTLTFAPSSASGVIDFQEGSLVVLGINPGSVSDRLSFIGGGATSLLFNGGLSVTASSYVPTAPEVFDLLDWTGLTGGPFFASSYAYTGFWFGNDDEAAGIDLPDISGTGFAWDFSAFMTSGSIAVVAVPEPSRALMLGVALLMTAWRRRRQAFPPNP